MDGDHPTVTGHDVERPTTEISVVAVHSGRWFQRLEHQMDVVWMLREIGSRRLGRQTRDERSIDPDGGGHGVEIVRAAPIEVDPQELAVADRSCETGFQLNLAVLAIGVV